jgi:catechol 2,3-dioxygenase-like lactoylglutathione lyase family enzyme
MPSGWFRCKCSTLVVAAWLASGGARREPFGDEALRTEFACLVRSAYTCRTMTLHVDHVVLWVEDASRALDFYTRVLGLSPVRAEEFTAGTAPFPSVRISEATLLDLMPSVAAQLATYITGEVKPTAAGRPLNHVCLAMSQAEFEGLAARLAEAGVSTHRVGEESFGARGTSRHWFYFQDPDGNVIEARHYE